MAFQDYLDQQIKKVCPIHGISFDDLNDKKSWKIHFKDEADENQKIKAQKVIDEFVWNDEIEKREARKKMIEENKNNLHMKAQYIMWKKENPNKTFEDFIDYVEAIEI